MCVLTPACVKTLALTVCLHESMYRNGVLLSADAGPIWACVFSERVCACRSVCVCVCVFEREMLHNALNVTPQ